MMSLTSSRLALVTALCAAAACASEPDPVTSSLLTVHGVVTKDGVPLEQMTVYFSLLTGQSTAERVLASDVVHTDVAGRFEMSFLGLDTVLVGPYAFYLRAQPLYGSGLRAVSVDGHVTFDEAGRADTQLAIAIERVVPPVADGPDALLDPARLVGRYDGRTVDPVTWINEGANLTVEIDSIRAARPFGHFVISFDLEDAPDCDNGGGENLIDGELGADTLHLRLLAGASREQDFEVTSPDALNDTLIVGYPPRGGGDCMSGFPAPLRLVRQVGP